MRTYVVRAVIFLLPILIYILIPLSFFCAGGELSSVHTIIRRQQQADTVVGMGYSNDHRYVLKKTTLAIRQPDIMALGTSRVMEFEDTFFKKNVRFYNAGGIIYGIHDLDTFFGELPAGYTPKVILLGLDQRFFNAQWNNGLHPGFTRESSLTVIDLLGNFFSYGLKAFYSDIYHHKFTFAKLYNAISHSQNTIGFNATLYHAGFRSDGSYYYGREIEDRLLRDSEVAATIDGILQGIAAGNDDMYGENIDQAAIESLRNFLAECKKRNIYVVGFLTPFSHQVYMRLAQSYNILKENPAVVLPKKLDHIFASQSFPFYDFSDVTSFGSSDDELVEVTHGGQKMYVRMTINMSKNDPLVQTYIDTNKLIMGLSTSTDPLVVFPIMVR